MAIDWELAEKALQKAAELEGQRWARHTALEVEGYEASAVAFALRQLHRDGFLRASILTTDQTGPQQGFVVEVLTKGHLAVEHIEKGGRLRDIYPGATGTAAPLDLTRDQETLLAKMVEAQLELGRAERFVEFLTHGGGGLHHAGFEDGQLPGEFEADLDELAAQGALRVQVTRHGRRFTLSPNALEWYGARDSKGAGRFVEEYVHRYLDDAAFRERHPLSQNALAKAVGLLTGDDAERDASTIGLWCREAAIFFATELIDRYEPQLAEEDQQPGRFNNRVRAVIETLKGRLSDEEAVVAGALADLWRAVVPDVQRQTHGAERLVSKGAKPGREDARRVTFITAMAMHEIDRSCERASGPA